MISTTRDPDRWRRWCSDAGVDDPYWSWNHLTVWAPEWNARPLGVRWTEERGDGDGNGRVETILHPVLQVPLDRLRKGAGLTDVRTAYDFAGPLHRGRDPTEAMARFEEEWSGWTLDNGVVTEFLRLHPTALPSRPSWALFHADNHAVDLTPSYEEIRSSYHGSWRRNLRKAEGHGLAVEVADTPPTDLAEAFIALYHRAMVALQAPFWFHFRNQTLRRFLALPDTGLVVVRDRAGEVLAAATYLASGSTLFYHLGCSERRGLDLRPNHRLFDALIRMGKKRGFRLLHLGGGSPSLRRFKRHLGNTTVPYFVVKRVVDPRAYAELCRMNVAGVAEHAFPAYIGRFAD